MNGITQEVASYSKERGPHDAPQRVEEQKGGPAHPIRPGQERGPGPQHRDKASKEDHLATMLQEEVLPQFQLALIKTNRAAIAAQQTVATFASNPEAQIITQNGPTGGSYNHESKGQAVRRPSINGGNEQHRLAREGNACALDGDKDEDGPIAIGSQQLLEIVERYRDHGVWLPFLPSQQGCFASETIRYGVSLKRDVDAGYFLLAVIREHTMLQYSAARFSVTSDVWTSSHARFFSREMAS